MIIVIIMITNKMVIVVILMTMIITITTITKTLTTRILSLSQEMNDYWSDSSILIVVIRISS